MHPTHSIRRALLAGALASLPLLLTRSHTTAQTTRTVTGLTIHVAALNAGVRVVPAHVPTGIMPFTVIDDLKGPAGVLVFRANAGYTLAQAIAIFENPKAPPGQLNRAATFVAGFTGFVPGQQLHGWVHLTPGAYAVVSGGNFKPHAQTFTVDARPAGMATAPATTAIVTMGENKFALPAVLPAGPVSLKVVNTDTDVHLGFVTRLSRTVSLAQLKAALMLPEPQQPAWLHSAAPTGAVGILSHGQTMWWTLALTPGHYALICPLPGPDGTPHFMMGMVKLFDAR